jgi:hypothetical protein
MTAVRNRRTAIVGIAFSNFTGVGAAPLATNVKSPVSIKFIGRLPIYELKESRRRFN